MNCRKKGNQRSLQILSEVAYGYGKKGRNKFPWRLNITPYRVFVSEFFLQRTGAIQVSKIFNSFISLYPNLSSISKSRRRKLLDLLHPLGLHHRTIAFLKASAQLNTDFRGRIPFYEEDLLKVYGVGKYLARAILCFGFNKPVGIVDPNTARIFERYFDLDEIKKRPQASPFLWQLADRVVIDKNRSARIINWGLLDIGREICRKRNPSCNECPLEFRCRSRIAEHGKKNLRKKQS